MSLNRYLEVQTQHALFSPSQPSWLRYDDEKIIERLRNRYRAPLGVEIHEYAARQILQSHRKTSVRAVADEIEDYIFGKYNVSGVSQIARAFGMELYSNVKTLPKEVFDAVKEYINDGIIFKMIVEQRLEYSRDISGTADAHVFNNNTLRIHDLKTGDHQPNMEQLEVYAALYCLQNKVSPEKIDIELRIYHLSGVASSIPDPNYILDIMDRIKEIEKIAATFRKDERL